MTLATGSRDFHWLRNAQFDGLFVFGLPLLATLTALVCVFHPSLFVPILILDLWFLGYHHVISTYTRLCFDKKSFATHRPMIFVLLPVVALVTLAVAQIAGIWAVFTVYFYWQWFHYTRQSWGVSRAYRAKEKDALYEDGWLDQAIFYAIPVLGIVNRSAQGQPTFLGSEILMMPMPALVVTVLSAATFLLLGYWVLRRVQAWREGRLAGAHTLYMLSHFAIFAIGYVLIEDMTYGWVAINIWHNAQYILFVWLFNTKRFKNGVDPQAPFLSYISQPDKIFVYLGTCIMITGILYWGVLGTLNALLFSGVQITIVMYQIFNFHHYIVDSVIWKVRSAPMRETLELNS